MMIGDKHIKRHRGLRKKRKPREEALSFQHRRQFARIGRQARQETRLRDLAERAYEEHVAHQKALQEKIEQDRIVREGIQSAIENGFVQVC